MHISDPSTWNAEVKGWLWVWGQSVWTIWTLDQPPPTQIIVIINYRWFYNHCHFIRVGNYLGIRLHIIKPFFFLPRVLQQFPYICLSNFTIIHVLACAHFYHGLDSTDYIHIEFPVLISVLYSQVTVPTGKHLFFEHCPYPTASTNGDTDRKSLLPGSLQVR